MLACIDCHVPTVNALLAYDPRLELKDKVITIIHSRCVLFQQYSFSASWKNSVVLGK